MAKGNKSNGYDSGLMADFIFANPPFKMSDWGGENLREDVCRKFGMPPVNNANKNLYLEYATS